MSWLSPRAVRRRRTPTRSFAPQLLEFEPRVNPTSILQYHVDSQSDGVNNSETVLTRSNVNVASFGKLYQIQVAGQVYAEPLVETGVNITVGPNQGMHNVVFVATEHDQLYAFDSDYNPTTQTTSQQLLWQRSFLSDSLNTNPGDLLAGNTSVTTVPQSAVISSDITVEIGITDTPVIDPNTGTIYLIAKTAETVGGTVHYVQRFYAINIQTGADQTAPYLLGDTTYNGSTYTNYASESSDPNKASDQIYVHGSGNGDVANPYGGTGNVVQFNALREAVRGGLDLVNGVVYMEWASHGDNGPYHGWMVAVSAYSTSTPTMALKGVLNTTPNGGLGGIWQAGGEITYADGFFYFETGNGTFDGGNGTGTGSNPTAPAPGPITGLNNAGFPINGDYGDSFVKVAIDPTTTATNQNITTGSATETVNSDGWGLKVVDFFTPFNQNYLNSTDLDVGSSAAVIVPDYNSTIGGTGQFASAAEPMLLVGSGKEGVIYLLDRDGAHQANLGPVAHTINYGSGFTTTGLTVNGSAAVTGGNLVLTSGSASQTGSAFYTTQQNIQQFSTTFTYTLGGTQGSTGEGVAFVLQKSAATALGTGGTSLGYAGLNPSFAVAISNDSTQGLGTEFLENGTVVANFTETNINTGLVGSPIQVTIGYNGSTVTATFTQGSNVDTKTFNVNLLTLLGSYSAFVGFTGSTSTRTSTQSISGWTFTASDYGTAYSGSMGGFGLQNNIVQNTANQLSGSLDSAAFFNNQMYYVQGYGGVAKSFTMMNGAFSLTAATQSPDQFAFAGSTPMISANNGSNGIVWDVDRGTNQLRAYSSDTYATELWNSAQAPNGRDALGAAVKFQVATVANGRVYVGSGTGDPNNVLVVYGLLAPPTNVPNAPSNLVAQPASSTQIALSWTDNSVSPNTADSFYVQESTNGGSTWTQVAVVSGTSTIISGLTPTTAYEFQVQAHDSFGVSGFSNTAMATTSAGGVHSINYSAGFTTANTTIGGGSNGGGLAFNGATQAVLVPGDNRLELTTNAGNQARSVYFTNPSDSANAGRQDIVTFTTTFTYNLTSSGSGPADGVTFLIQNDSRGLTALGAGGGALGYTGITPSLALGINVYGGNALGTEILTNGTVDENFSETNINTQLVNTPITITLTYVAGTLFVTEQQTVNSVLQTDTKSLSINLPALLGTDYAYVGFTGATGGANSTQEITNWTFDQGLVPATPTNLAATVTGYNGGANGTVPTPIPLGANLTWNAVTDTPPAGGTVSYKIYRKFTAGGTYALVGTSTTNGFSDTGLATGSNYFYEVTATDSYSDSLPSTAVSITTPTLPPTATMSQINSITGTSISFQWQDNANNENGYLILRQIGINGFTILTTLPPDTNPAPSIMTFTDTGLAPGTHYDYHIQSYNLAGYSDFAGVSGDTTVTAPTNLVATAGSGTIGLSWTGVGSSGATYSIYRGTSPGAETAPVSGVTTTTYTDAPPTFGVTYYYDVTATVGGAETAASNEASAFASGPTTTTLQVSPNPATTTQTVTLKATIASAGGTPAAGSVVFYDGGNPLATVSLNASGIATYSTTFANGTHSLTAIYAGTSGFTPSSTTQPTQEVIGPPVVSSIQVNDGSAERSEVRSISVTFSGPVVFTGGNANAAAAFQLQHVQDATNVANLAATVSTNVFGQTVVTLTFTATGNSSAEIDPESVMNGGAASLADGRYQLTVLSANVTDSNGVALDGNGDGTAGDNYVSPADTQGGGPGQLHLFRLFGDTDGSGIVDQLDLAQFRSANNSSSGSSAYLAYLDADNSGTIDQLDLAQFRARNNSSIF